MSAFWWFVGGGVFGLFLMFAGAYYVSNSHAIKKAVAASGKPTAKNEVFVWIACPANIELWLMIEDVSYRALMYRFLKDDPAGGTIEFMYKFAGVVNRRVKLYPNRWHFDNREKRTFYGMRITIVVHKGLTAAEYAMRRLEDEVRLRDEIIESMQEDFQKLSMNVAALKAREKMEERVSEHSTIDGFGSGTLDDTGTPQGLQQGGS